ncbi:hypothetical protein OG349_23770 [Streptomyces sp. NBC_01317]|uniref:hypothetical protein n=1 Tax=Streptomyces sp. NBC_01317 TaxID=2903822 RepID=UPI002E106B46|nr:hypothetical protein OG349_23770 [Streptomyces sp. NBC_01317]
MRIGLIHAIAWSLATGAAVTLSWWGVHTVMAGTAYDPPRAVPIGKDSATTQGARPVVSSTHRPPSPSPSPPSPSARKPEESAKPSPTLTFTPVPVPSQSYGGPASKPAAAPSSPAPQGNVKSYAVDGGRVVLDIGEAAAELVSATPDSGWQMQVWTQPTWIRVTFTRDGREVSVFCTWHDHPPLVEFDDR